MKNKKNCWEHFMCGRQQGGARVKELGICPASTDTNANGLNGGINGGRICWSISGTFCMKTLYGIFAKKYDSCISCEFFKKVKHEEEICDFKYTKPDNNSDTDDV